MDERRRAHLLDHRGPGDLEHDPDADHSPSNSRVRTVSPPAGSNGLWISTPCSVLPCCMSSVKTMRQPASAAVATSSASQYAARPTAASDKAVRTEPPEASACGNTSSQ